MSLSTRLLSGLALLAGVWSILTGWFALTDRFWLERSIDPQIIIVMPDAVAAALIGLGVAVLLLRKEGAAWRKRVGQALAALCLGYGVLTMLFFFYRADLVSFWPFYHTSLFRRPGDPSTSLKLMLLAGGLLMLNQRNPSIITRTELVSFAAFVISFQSVVGYAYRVTSFYTTSQNRDMIWSFLAFLFLSVAIFTLRPERGITRIFLDRSVGTLLFRSLLAPSAVVLVVLGWLSVGTVRYKMFYNSTAVSLLVAAAVLLVLMLVMRTAVLLHRLERERREASEALKRMYDTARLAQSRAEDALESKNKLLAMISHELRTPLTPALMESSCLLRRPELPEEMRSALGRIQRNIATEARLINELLEYTHLFHKKTRLQMEEIDLHEVIQKAVNLCCLGWREKGLKLAISLEAGSSRILGDAERLQQVFWNLLKNAEKFTPGSGTIRLQTWNEDGEVCCCVEDEGVGIEPELLPHIFDPFRQGAAAASGLGLGLSIARSIVDAHEGCLQAQSEGLGRGAKFDVRFETVTVPQPAAFNLQEA